MLLAWMLLRKMIRIARVHRITSIADFIASRYGKSRLLAALVTLIAVVGIVPYVALQLKAIASRLFAADERQRCPARASPALPGGATARSTSRWCWPASRSPSAPAISTPPSATRAWSRRSPSSRWSSCSRSSPSASFVTWGLFDGPGDIFARASARADLKPLLGLGGESRFAGGQWFALTLLSMLSVIFLPRQFQVMVVENVDERHVHARGLGVSAVPAADQPVRAADRARRAAALRRRRRRRRDLRAVAAARAGQPLLALVAFIGGLSAATGMVIVEAIAVSTMVCNDLRDAAAAAPARPRAPAAT